MSVLGALARALHLLVTPVFLGMAVLAFHLEAAGFDHAAHGAASALAASTQTAPAGHPQADHIHAGHDHTAHGADHIAHAPAEGVPIALGPIAVAAPEPLARALTSMWLMYLLMALAHAPPWFGQAAARAGGRP